MPGLLLALVLTAEPARWTATDTATEAAVLVSLTVDWAQTRTIARTPGRFERNPILGGHPSAARVNVYFAASMVAHAAVAAALPRPWRRGWQHVVLVVEAGAIGHNATTGVGLTLPW